MERKKRSAEKTPKSLLSPSGRGASEIPPFPSGRGAGGEGGCGTAPPDALTPTLSQRERGDATAPPDALTPTLSQRERGGASPPPPGITLAEFQQLIRQMYLRKDVARGAEGTFMWLMEEIGELAAALRNGTPEQRAAEFADVLAWLATIANVAGVDLAAAVMEKYGSGCPGCGRFVCTCPDAGKP